jgi:hypothetical protein
VVSSTDAALHGTRKVVLPTRPAGFGYAIEARCHGCTNDTAAALVDIGFGEVWLCSGQSNMEDPVLTTLSRHESHAAAAAGTYDHIRLFQLGCGGVWTDRTRRGFSHRRPAGGPRSGVPSAGVAAAEGLR